MSDPATTSCVCMAESKVEVTAILALALIEPERWPSVIAGAREYAQMLALVDSHTTIANFRGFTEVRAVHLRDRRSRQSPR